MMCVDQIKCAHCKGYHESIAGVRSCSSVQAAQQIFMELDIAPSVQQEVPEGRYAIERSGKWSFYRVARPTQGRWADRVFVDHEVGDDQVYPIKYPAQRLAILDRIAQDPATAMINYGKQMGRCGHCGRRLRNAESIAAGIGPVCRQAWNFL